MRKLLTLALAGFLTAHALAQDKKSDSAPKEPKTKLEAFEAKTGAVIIRGFGTIGRVQGRLDTSAEIECKEFTDASTGMKEYGITITVKDSSTDYKREHVSYIDYDEIGSLLKGIDYISKVDKTATKLDNFQADYRTKGELTVSTYNESDVAATLDDATAALKRGTAIPSTLTPGKIQAAVESGRFDSVTTYLSLDGLAEFRGLIEKAKAKLDSIRQSPPS